VDGPTLLPAQRGEGGLSAMSADGAPDGRSDAVGGEDGGAPYAVRPCDPLAARELGRAVGIDAAVAQVLLHRGVRESAEVQRFLEPTLRELTPPDGMADREAAAERLARAVKAGERVVVFGDYDVDGTTSAALLADVLEALGGDVRALVASRFGGGYGLSDEALERCLALSPKVLVTCDCGSSDHERVARAVARGVDVVVVDHHLVPDEPLPAHAFLNPHRPECAFPYKGMASAGLAFSLGAAVRARLGAALDLRPWLDLVALGTVADLAPLDGDNRRLVRAGLALLGRADGRPGVVALRASARLKAGQPVTGTDVAFRLAPRLNAAGRLGDPSITLALLRARSAVEAANLAKEIEACNERRKAIEREVTAQAIAQALEVYGEAPEHGVVVAGEGFHPGVIGITAAKLVERFHRPALVVALEGAEGTVSGRTPKGVDLHAALERCAASLVRFGGHAAAAGATVRATDVERLRAAFADATRGPWVATRPALLVDAVLGAELPVPSLRSLHRLEPTGMGNEAPRFALRAAVVDARTVGEGAHLKLTLHAGARSLSAFAPNMGERREGLPSEVLAIGALRADGYRGGDALELQIEQLHPG
jgi:single-stranded-DNA-specific exonuclease